MGKSHAWWWDSHINPKNSKWLEDSLQAMDVKVKEMLKLIEEDADSFAQRAEMYYKKRPELVSLVEEFYRSYRSLAERYDLLTGELRKNMPEPESPYGERLTFKNKSRGRPSQQDGDAEDGTSRKSKKKKKDEDSDSSSSSSSSSDGESDDHGKEKKRGELELKLSELQNELKKLEEENFNLKSSYVKLEKLEVEFGSMEKERTTLRDEVAVTKESLKNALAEVQAKQEEFQKLKQESAKLSSENKALIDDLRKEHEKINVVLAEMGLEEGSAIQDMFKELQQDCSRLQQENEVFAKDKEVNATSISHLESEIEELKASQSKLLVERDVLLKEQTDLQEKHKGGRELLLKEQADLQEMHRGEVDAHEKEKSGLRELHGNLLGEHKETVSQHETLKKEVLARSEQILELQAEISELQTQKMEHESAISAQTEYAKQLQARLSDVLEKSSFEQDRSTGEEDLCLHQFQTLEHGIVSLHENRRVSEERASSLEAKLQKLQAELASAEEKVRALTGECQAKVDEKAALAAKMKELEEELKQAEVKTQETLAERDGTLTSLQQAKAELEGKMSLALEEIATLQTTNQNLLEESTLQSKRLQEELLKAQEQHATLSNEHQRGLDETLLMTTSLEALRKEHQYLQEQHKGLKDEHLAISEAKCKLETDGADKEKKTAELVGSLEEQISHLQDEKAVLAENIQAELRRSEELELQIKEQLTDMQHKHGEVATLMEERQVLQGKHDSLKEVYLQLQQDKATACEKLDVEVRTLKEELSRTQEQHFAVTAMHKEVSGALEKATEEHRSLQGVHNSLQDEHSELKCKLETEGAEKDGRLHALEEEMTLLKTGMDAQLEISRKLEVDLSQLKEELLKAQEQHVSLTSTHEDVLGSLQMLTEEHLRLQETHKDLQAQHLAIGEAKCNLEADGAEKEKTIAEHVNLVSTLQQHIAKMQSEMDNQLKVSEKLELDLSTLKEELSRTQEEHGSLATMHGEVSATLGKITEEHQSLRELHTNLQVEHSTITKLKCKLEAKGAETEQKLVQHASQARTLQEQIGQLQNEMDNQLQISKQLNVEITQLKEELCQARDQHASLTSSHKDVLASFGSITEDHQRLQEIHKDLQAQHLAVGKIKCKLEADVEEQEKTITEHLSLVSTLQEQVAKLTAEVSTLMEELSKTQEKHGSLVATHGEVTAAFEKVMEEHRGLQELHENLQLEHSAISELKCKLETDGGEMEQKFVEKANEARTLQDQVSQLQSMMDSQLQISKELDLEITQLKEELSEAQEQHASLTTTHKDVLASFGTITAYHEHLQESHRGLQAQHLVVGEVKCKLEADVEEKDKMIAEHLSLASTLQEQVAKLQTKMDTQLVISDGLKAELSTLKEELSRTQEQHGSLITTHSEVSANLGKLTEEHKNLQMEHSTISELKCKLETKVAEMEQKLVDQACTLQEQISQLQNERDAQLQLSKELNLEITHLKEELSEAREQHASLTTTHKDVLASFGTITADHERLQETHRGLQVEHSSVSQKQEKAITEHLNHVVTLQEQITNMRKELDSQLQLSEKLNVEINMLKEELSELQEQHGSLTTKHEEVSASLGTLTQDHQSLQLVHKDLQVEHSTLSELKCKLETEGATKDQEIDEHLKNVHGLQEHVARLQNEKDALTKDLEELRREKHEQHAAITSSYQELSAAFASLKEEKHQLQELYKELQEKHAEVTCMLELEIKRLKDELLKSEEQHATLSSSHQRGIEESMVLASSLNTLKGEHDRLQENHRVYTELKNKLETEVGLLQTEKEQQTSELRAAVLKLEEDLSTALQQHKDVQSGMKAEHETHIQSKDEVIQKMEADISRLEEAVAHGKEEIKVTLEEKAILEGLVNELQAEVSTFKVDIESLQSNIATSSQRVVELETQCKLAEDKVVESLMAAQAQGEQIILLEETLKTKASELQQSTQRILTIEQELQLSRDQGVKLTAVLESMVDKSGNMDKELQELRETLENSQQELIGIKQVAEVDRCSKTELEGVVTKLQAEIVTLSALEALVASLQTEKSALTSEAEDMKQKLSAFEEQERDVKVKLESQIKEVEKLQHELIEGKHELETAIQRSLEEKTVLEGCSKELREQVQQLGNKNRAFSEHVQVLSSDVEKLKQNIEEMKAESEEFLRKWLHEKEELQAELTHATEKYSNELEVMKRENVRTLASLDEKTQLHESRELELETVKKSRASEIMGLFRVLAFGEEQHVEALDNHEALERKALEVQSRYLELKQQNAVQENDIALKSGRLRELEEELEKVEKEKAAVSEELQRTLKQEEEEHSEYEQQIENMTAKCRELEALRQDEMHKLYAVVSLPKVKEQNGTGDITFDLIQKLVSQLQENFTKAKEHGACLSEEVGSKRKRLEELEGEMEHLKEEKEEKSAEYEQHSASLRLKLEELEALRKRELANIYKCLGGEDTKDDISARLIDEEITGLLTRMEKLKQHESSLREELSEKTTRLHDLEQAAAQLENLLKGETLKAAEYEQQLGSLNMELRKLEVLRNEEMSRLFNIFETLETEDVSCDSVEKGILSLKEQSTSLHEEYVRCLEKSAEYKEQIKQLSVKSEELETSQEQKLLKLYSVLGLERASDGEPRSRSLPVKTDISDDFLEEKITELKEQKQALSNDIVSKSTRIQELEEMIEELKQEKCALEQDYQQRSETEAKKAAEYMEQIGKLELKIQEVEQENQKLREELSCLQLAKETEVQKLEVEKSEFKSKITDFEETLEGLHIENRTLGDSLAAETLKHNEGIQALQNKLNHLEEENRTLLEDSSKVKELQEELHSAHEENRLLRFELSKRDLLVRKLEGEFAILQGEKDEVGDKLQAEIEKVSKIQVDLLELREEDKRLKNKVDALTSKVENLEEKLSALERENKALLVKAEGKEQQNKSLVILLRFLRAEVTSMVLKAKTLRNNISVSELALRDKDADLVLLLEDVKKAQAERQKTLEENVMLARKVSQLHEENKLQQAQMAEEKREVIRQLCFSLNCMKENNQRMRLRAARLSNNVRPESPAQGTWKKYLNPWFKQSPPPVAER